MIKLDRNAAENAALRPLIDEAEIVRFKKGETVIKMGSICNYLFLIEQGMLRNFYYDQKGKDITHWFSSEGMIVTSPPSFFKREPSFFEIQALEDTVVKAISYIQFEQALEHSQALERFARKLVTEVMITLGRKVIDLQTQSAAHRYDALLISHPDIFQRANLGHIAGYLGITQQTLSKIRASKLG